MKHFYEGFFWGIMLFLVLGMVVAVTMPNNVDIDAVQHTLYITSIATLIGGVYKLISW